MRRLHRAEQIWRALALALVLALGSLPVSASNALAGRYHVTRLKGTALVWMPSSTRWEPLRLGALLPEGTLLQLTGAGKVTLDGRAPAPGTAAPPGIVVDSAGPVLVRLDTALARRVDFGGYFLSVPDLQKGDKGAKEEGLLFSLREAFERTVAIFDTTPRGAGDRPVNATDIDTGGGGQVQNGDEDAQVQRRDLPLLHPREGDTYLVALMPTVVAVQWRDPPDGAKRYVVTLQRMEKDGLKQVATTNETYHRFDIAEPGRYRVAVESEDGLYRSKPHAFQVSVLGE